MKVTMLLVATLISSMAFSADGEKRNETRERVLGESVLQVSDCVASEVTAYEFDEIKKNQDGSYATNKDGSYKYIKMTRFSANAGLAVSKCQSKEQYMVEVTGSFWNAKASEVPGSAKAFGQITNQNLSFSASKDVNLKALMNASNGNDWFEQSGAVQMIETFKKGVKEEAMSKCLASAAQLARAVVPVSQTVCK